MRNGAAAGIAPLIERRVGGVVGACARWLAYGGGVVLISTGLMTIASIIGRAWGRVFTEPVLGMSMGAVPGDYELVGTGCAIAVFAFLPYCQFNRGHVTVDLLFTRATPRAVAFASLVGNFLLTLAAVLIAWRLQAGAMDRYAYRETSYILQFPLWWGYTGALVGAWAFAAISLYTVWRSYNEWRGAGEVLFAAVDR